MMCVMFCVKEWTAVAVKSSASKVGVSADINTAIHGGWSLT